MRRHLGLLFLIASAGSAFAQEATVPGPASVAPETSAAAIAPEYGVPVASEPEKGGLLSGDRAFPGFIGWVSNPVKAIDPRSLTQLWPVFGSAWTDSIGPLPGGNVQLLGPGLSIALTDRLEIGVNYGGYAFADFHKSRQGWLNTGGFVQYTLIRDIPDQFILSAGAAWVFPLGESDVFQGHGPTKMSSYLTAGKEFGNVHVLTTNGFTYPISPGKNDTTQFYGSVHIDRRTFGWLYPLVEFNYGSKLNSLNLDIPAPHDFLTLGGVNPSIAMLTVAPGINMVLIQNRLELGAVYQTPIASEHNFHFNQVIVKMILRY